MPSNTECCWFLGVLACLGFLVETWHLPGVTVLLGCNVGFDQKMENGRDDFAVLSCDIADFCVHLSINLSSDLKKKNTHTREHNDQQQI